MSSSTNSEEIIVEFQKKIECFNTIKQLAVVQKKELVFKYIKNNETELMGLLDKNLTKVQMKAFEKLDETAQKHVKDSLVRNVLITAWDEKDDELASLVKSKVKAALDEGKEL